MSPRPVAEVGPCSILHAPADIHGSPGAPRAALVMPRCYRRCTPPPLPSFASVALIAAGVSSLLQALGELKARRGEELAHAVVAAARQLLGEDRGAMRELALEVEVDGVELRAEGVLHALESVHGFRVARAQLAQLQRLLHVLVHRALKLQAELVHLVLARLQPRVQGCQLLARWLLLRLLLAQGLGPTPQSL